MQRLTDEVEQRKNERLLYDLIEDIYPSKLGSNVEAPVSRQVSQEVYSDSRIYYWEQ